MHINGRIGGLLKLVAILVITPVWAESAINGAFGFEFGTQLSSNQNQGTVSWETPPVVGDYYYATATSPVAVFDMYMVGLTPDSKQIFVIRGYSAEQTQNECERDRNAIKSILERKYNLTFDEVILSDSVRANSGNVSIMLHCKGFVDVNLILTYQHNDIYKIAQEEQTKMDAEKLDSSGL